MQSHEHFYLSASTQNSEAPEELLKAEESHLICQKQKKKFSSNFRRRKSNRIYDLLLLEHIFWHKLHTPINFYFSSKILVFDSPLSDEFDQIMSMGPKLGHICLTL